jgi:hypothetical protein
MSLEPAELPPVFRTRLAGRGWALRPNQAAMLVATAEGVDALPIAPTGGADAFLVGEAWVFRVPRGRLGRGPGGGLR